MAICPAARRAYIVKFHTIFNIFPFFVAQEGVYLYNALYHDKVHCVLIRIFYKQVHTDIPHGTVLGKYAGRFIQTVKGDFKNEQSYAFG